MEWNIGNIKIKNQVGLAPMAGVSNPAYMKICEDMGVGFAVTELISSEAVVRGNKKTLEMLNGIKDLSFPVAIQIFGSNPGVMASSAKILTDLYNVKWIDINMGCPVPKVAVKSKAGSALLKDLDMVYDIVSAVVNAVDAVVTVKIRSGWDMNSINAVDVAKTIERAGASAICVHPRTRSQGYSGNADWSIIRAVKNNVSIPIIGNGDIRKPEDAKRMLAETNCDAVMIGRAALGNPWIIKNTISLLNNEKLYEFTLPERIDICLKHLDYLREFRNDKVASLEIRNHIGWYFKGIKGANDLKNKIYQTSNIHDIIAVLNEFKEENYE